MIFIPIIVFGLGLIIGSFLNVVILRLNTGRSIAKGRSKCPRCSNVLSWYELIPVFSFLGQKGKCRSCKAPISFQYPLIELITALVFVLIYTHIILDQGFTIYAWVSFLFSTIVASLLIVVTVYDIRHKIIPPKISYPFVILGFISIIWKVMTIPGFSFINNVLAGLLLAAPFFFLWFFSKGKWMGFGDIVLALGIGWLVGTTGAIAVFLLSFWIGALAGLVLIAFSNAYGIKSEVPFAPFLVLALFIVGVFGVTLSTLFPIWP